MSESLDRRDFVRTGVLGAAGLLTPSLLACSSGPSPVSSGQPFDPFLSARPGTPTVAPTLGASPLGIWTGRDGILYVPTYYTPDRPLPLAVAFHGSAGNAASWNSWHPIAENRGFIFLAIDSRDFGWNPGGPGNTGDTPFVDIALAHTFERCAVDPAAVALFGYSSGASYGMSMGVSNGDLFTHLVSFAPSYFLPRGDTRGKPRVFAAHGTFDPVAPVEFSREMVALLENEGYDVTYREFAGDHTIAQDVALESLDWFGGR